MKTGRNGGCGRRTGRCGALTLKAKRLLEADVVLDDSLVAAASDLIPAGAAD